MFGLDVSLPRIQSGLTGIRRMGPGSDAKMLGFAAFDKAEPRFRDARQRCQLTAVSPSYSPDRRALLILFAP